MQIPARFTLRTSWYSFLVQNKARRSIFSRAPTGKFPLTIPRMPRHLFRPSSKRRTSCRNQRTQTHTPLPQFASPWLAMLASILTLGANAFAQTLPPSQYISFDAPNAGTGQYQGTGPSSINRQGWIGSTVVYSTGASHGFLRKPNGAFIAVNPPNSSQSFVAAINDSNEATGHFYGPSATYGFLRDAAGNYTQLAVAGSNTNKIG